MRTLTDFQVALLRARGYEYPRIEARSKYEFVAISVKGQSTRAEALGRSPEEAVRHLIKVITRR